MICTIKFRTFAEIVLIMTAQLNKDERIEIRISPQDKKMFKKAQELSGDRSFSSFIIRIVKDRAEEIVAKNNRIIASERDREKFFEVVFGNNKPNRKLAEAAQNYKSKNTLQ